MAPLASVTSKRLGNQQNRALFKTNAKWYFSVSIRQFHSSVEVKTIDSDALNTMFREEAMSEEERGRDYWISLGHAAGFENRDEDALKAYKEALRYDPTSAEPYFQMSAILKGQGKLDESIEASFTGLRLARELLTYNPHRNKPLTSSKMANEYARIGMCYLQKQMHMEAHKWFRESLVRYDTRNVRDALEHVETTYFTREVRRVNGLEVDRDKDFQKYVAGLPFLVRETPIGRGLFSTKSFKQGDILFKESPLMAIPDLDNPNHRMCWHCLRSLEPTQFGFASEEFRDTASVLPPEQLVALQDEICTALEMPRLNVCEDTQGHKYCTPDCRTEALQYFQTPLLALPLDSPDLRMLLPTHSAHDINIEEAEKDGQTVMLKELSTIEMMTRLLATIKQRPFEQAHLDRIAYMHLEPQPMLLEHQQLQLDALRKLFPEFSNSLLTTEGYWRLKGIVELNTFSTETHALIINFGEAAEPQDDVPEDADESSAQQLGLQILMRDDVQIKGHALYRLGSLMNHSCDPNVGMAQPALTSKASWVALRDISLGEELLDSYVALEEGAKHDREQRRQMLFENYHFWCNCKLCASGN